MTDKEIIESIRSRNELENSSISALYRSYCPMVVAVILRKGGSRADAEDIFQDAVIVLYEQIKSSKFRAESSIKTYLYRLAVNMWLNKAKRKQVVMKWEAHEKHGEEFENSPLEIMLDEEKQKVITDLMAKLGDRCREILDYKLYHRLNMTEIAAKMGFSSSQIARNKLYRCKSELKKLAVTNDRIKHFLPWIK